MNTRTCSVFVCAAFLAGAICGRFTIDAQAPQPSPLPQEQVIEIGVDPEGHRIELWEPRP